MMINNLTDNLMTVAIDIGNTNTHVAAVSASAVRADTVDIDALCFGRVDFLNDEFDAKFSASIKNITAAHKNISAINISSCVKKLADRAVNVLTRTNKFSDINIIKYHDGLPIQILYNDPTTLGTDRICAALACAALFPNQDCVIIDAGTAVTVDFLRSGKHFEGGAILPGITMQTNALNIGADALRCVDTTKNLNIKYPATSTADCVVTGIIYGIVGAIEKIIHEVTRENVNTKIITTGGAWKFIAPHVNTSSHHHQTQITNIPDLTLFGIGIIPSV